MGAGGRKVVEMGGGAMLQILQILQEPQVPCNPPKGDFAIETRVRGACPRRGRPRAPGRDPQRTLSRRRGTLGSSEGDPQKRGVPDSNLGRRSSWSRGESPAAYPEPRGGGGDDGDPSAPRAPPRPLTGP